MIIATAQLTYLYKLYKAYKKRLNMVCNNFRIGKVILIIITIITVK